MSRSRIGITQNANFIADRGEMREDLDIQLCKLLWRLGLSPIPVSSFIDEKIKYFAELDLDGFLLSGGNNIGSVPERDESEKAILKFSIENNLPVLGICRGMQMINSFQGGKCIEVEGHVAVNHIVNGSITSNTDRKVNSFHNYGITDDTLGEDLIAVAKSRDNLVEAICHCEFPWLGIMWHPERDLEITTSDEQIIHNHLVRRG